MAKKVVATLKKEGGVKYAKIIKAVKNPTTGAYTFEEIILQDEVSAALKKESKNITPHNYVGVHPEF